MSETVTIIIMLSLLNTVLSADHHDSELVKIAKRHNENVTMTCSLSANHVEYNHNTIVSWYYLKTCKYCATNAYNAKKEEWRQIDCNGSCKVVLTLDNANALEGYYQCKIFPYHVDYRTTLGIEITKTFLLEVADNSKTSLPEILDETQNKFTIAQNTQAILQCKCRSHKQKPAIKWFKQKPRKKSDDNEDDNAISFIENPRAIKYFENFYQPIASSGLKELDDYMYLSKLIINNITEDSIYVCVAINYYGFVYRDFTISIEKISVDIDEDYESGESFDMSNFKSSDHKSFGIFLIPFLLFIIIFVQISTIVYLMIYRSIIKETNKHFV